MTKNNSLRSFVALDIPRAFRAELSNILTDCRKICPYGIRWIEPENLHFTLHFLGSIELNKLNQIKVRLNKIFEEQPIFSVFNPQIEIFPYLHYTSPDLNDVSRRSRVISNENVHKARLVWVKCDYQDNCIEHSVHNLRQLIDDLSLTTDKKPFKMHLTLGRIKKKVKGSTLEQILSLNLQDKKWKIKDVTLYESRLHSYGAEYIKLETYRLKDNI